MKRILSIFLVIFLFLIGCNFSSKTYYKVRIYDGYGKLLKVYTVVDGANMVKIPTVSKGEEIFLGWDFTDDGVVDEIPEKVVRDMTLVPVFKEEGSIEITFKNYDGTILEVVYVRKGEKPTYSKAEPVRESTLDTDFTFDGWDKAITDATENTIYTAIYSSSDRLYTYNFYDKDGKLLLSKTGKYNDNIEYPSDQVKESDLEFSYKFLGWSIDNSETLSYVSKLDQDYNFYPVFKKSYIEYEIKFYDGSTLIDSKKYHYGDDVTEPLMHAKKVSETFYGFVGWDINSDGVKDEVAIVNGDCSYYAIYTDNQILFVNIGEDLYAGYLEAGKNIDLSQFVSPKGYKYGWYLDSEFNTLLSNYVMPSGNLSIYGKLEILFNLNTDILDYKPSGKVGSREELQTLFDYLIFTMTTSYKVKLDYSFTDVSGEIGELSDNCAIKDNYAVSTKYIPLTKELSLEISFQEKNTTSSTPSYTQVYNKTCYEHPKTRSDGQALYIDGVSKTFNVNNSDQLFYVLEHGYKPIIRDSNLNNLYNKMKDVLREIIDDNMNDYQKVTAIYEWIINEVTYDGVTFNKVINGDSNVGKYHCFYLEGVFNEKLAVCDGISKAFASLCSMEGIPCVQVVGVSKMTGVNHAWNKVLVGNDWFIVDATSGGTVVSDSYEVLTHNFLLKDEDFYKAYYLEEVDPNYEFEAKGSYSYYSNTFVTNNGNDYDLSCTSIEEMVDVFKAFYKICSAGDSFEFYMDFDYGLSPNDEIQETLERLHDSTKITYLNDGNVVIILIK